MLHQIKHHTFIIYMYINYLFFQIKRILMRYGFLCMTFFCISTINEFWEFVCSFTALCGWILLKLLSCIHGIFLVAQYQTYVPTGRLEHTLSMYWTKNFWIRYPGLIAIRYQLPKYYVTSLISKFTTTSSNNAHNKRNLQKSALLQLMVIIKFKKKNFDHWIFTIS